MLFYGYYGIYAMLPVILLGVFVQFRLNSAYKKYSKLANSENMTGAMIAKQILEGAGIFDVQINCINGHLSDHYDPVRKTVNLSSEIFNGTSIAAIGVAAHECGHAIQHRVGYFPLKLRSAAVGITNLSSKILYFLLIGSFFVFSSSYSALIFNIASICYAIIFLFQLLTLPVEYNASNRALALTENAGFDDQSLKGVKSVLSAAALTYVAAAVTALWQLLIMLNRTRNRR